MTCPDLQADFESKIGLAMRHYGTLQDHLDQAVSLALSVQEAGIRLLTGQATSADPEDALAPASA